MIRRLVPLASLALLMSSALAAQDTTTVVHLSLQYVNGSQPGMVVVAGPGLDSVRKIVERDLLYSDRFTVPQLPDSAARLTGGAFDPQLFRQFGYAWAVELEQAPGGVDMKLYDVVAGKVQLEVTRPLDLRGVGDGRMAIHRLSDEIVASATLGIGIAATRILFLRVVGTDNGIWRIDSDGANLVRLTKPGGYFLHAAWSPDATAVAYSESTDGRLNLYMLRLDTMTRIRVPTGTGGGDAYNPAFSPDGKELAFAFNAPGKFFDIGVVNIAGTMCCARALTATGQVANNITPTYSQDGRRIAFLSTRTGKPQIYVMDADGTGVTLLVPLDPAETYAPEWSPDGSKIAFARDASSGRQVFTYTIGSDLVTQHTSVGSNEDPSWAPDSRHIVLKSRRNGPEQLWILDLTSGNWRALVTTPGITARLPAWSRSITTP